MRALLDVNVLIALHDSDHVHHAIASAWLQAHIGHGWASCPLTQNGCLRIMAQPGYGKPQPLATLVAMLGRSTSTRFHEFWADSISLLDERLMLDVGFKSPRVEIESHIPAGSFVSRYAEGKLTAKGRQQAHATREAVKRARKAAQIARRMSR